MLAHIPYMDPMGKVSFVDTIIYVYYDMLWYLMHTHAFGVSIAKIYVQISVFFLVWGSAHMYGQRKQTTYLNAESLDNLTHII